MESRGGCDRRHRANGQPDRDTDHDSEIGLHLRGCGGASADPSEAADRHRDDEDDEPAYCDNLIITVARSRVIGGFGLLSVGGATYGVHNILPFQSRHKPGGLSSARCRSGGAAVFRGVSTGLELARDFSREYRSSLSSWLIVLGHHVSYGVEVKEMVKGHRSDLRSAHRPCWGRNRSRSWFGTGSELNAPGHRPFEGLTWWAAHRWLPTTQVSAM